MEMYINGVSTRKVRKIVEPLCGENVSKTMVSRLCKELDHDMRTWNERDLSESAYPFLLADALYVRVRFGHQVMKEDTGISLDSPWPRRKARIRGMSSSHP